MADKTLSIRIEGLKEFTKIMGRYPEISGRNIQDAIKKSIFEIEREAKPRTPVDTGRLVGNYATDFKPLRGVLENDLEYAVVQHETLHFRHNVGEAKFLEKGAHAASSQIEKFFSDAISKTLKTITR